jgi:hypothetical protein
MASTNTTRNLLEKPGLGDYKNTWGDEINENFDFIDIALDGAVSIAGTAALTDAQARYRIITQTTSGTINLPAREKWYIVRNTGTSSCTVRVTGGVGANVVVPQGVTAQVYCDGTDCFFISGHRMLALLQTQATTSGTSKTFNANTLNLANYTELILRFDGVSHAGAGNADLRMSMDGSITWAVLGTFAAAATVRGAARIQGHVYASVAETGFPGFVHGAVQSLSGLSTGTGGGFAFPFSFNSDVDNIAIDFNGETFDAGSVSLYGK